MGGQVLIHGPKKEASTQVRGTAQTVPCWCQLRRVVIDLQDLNGQGSSGRVGWGSWRRETVGCVPLRGGPTLPSAALVLTIILNQNDSSVPAALEEG